MLRKLIEKNDRFWRSILIIAYQLCLLSFMSIEKVVQVTQNLDSGHQVISSVFVTLQ